MVAHNNSILPSVTEDNYLLSPMGFGNNDTISRRYLHSQRLNYDGGSDTSSSVKETTMIRIIKTVVLLIALMLLSGVAYKTVTYKLDTLKQARETVSPVTAQMRQTQLDCLARNIYHEAGGEPFEGKVAVAQVTLNRVESGHFPSDICRVVYQKNIVYEKVLCQFSWYCDSASTKKPMNGPVYIESMEVAKKVLLEGFRLPSIKDALYFHGDYINPGWKRERVAKVGRHIFYK
jgi:hypothetical protein